MQNEYYALADCRRLDIQWTCPPNVGMLRANPKRRSPQRKVDPQVAAAKANRLKLEARIEKLEQYAAAEQRAQALQKRNAELKERLGTLQHEADRIAKGGFQSRIRTGEFSKSSFKVSLGRKSAAKKPKSKRLGFEAKIASSMKK